MKHIFNSTKESPSMIRSMFDFKTYAVIVTAVFMIAPTFAGTHSSADKNSPKGIETMSNLQNFSIDNILNKFKGSIITVHLTNGTTISGKLGGDVDYTAAATKLVKFTELEGKDLFDAFISKEMICAVSYRRP